MSSGPLGYIRQILPFSAVDGPGNRAVVFFQGCNLRCLTCHNPETIPMALDKAPVTPTEVIEAVLKYRAFIDGVTLTGGECTCQPEFLTALVQGFKAQGIPVLLDSNGLRSQVILAVADSIEGVMLDIKSADPQEHQQLTGQPFEAVADSFEALLARHLIREVRTVVHPDLQWQQTLKWVSARIVSAPEVRYKVIGFRPHGVLGEWGKKQGATKAFMETVEAYLVTLGMQHYIIV